MEIINGNREDLIKLFNDIYSQIKLCDSDVEKYALLEYTEELYSIINRMPGKKIVYDRKMWHGTKKKQQAYCDYIANLLNRGKENFIAYKKFHYEFFDDVLSITDEILEEYEDFSLGESSVILGKEIFLEIFFEFLREHGLEKNFDNFIRNNKCFSIPRSDDFFGMALHNPVMHNSNIVFGGFNYSLDDLFTCSHEFGHVYDLSKIRGRDSGEKNLHYLYCSVYGEVISTMFERLLIDFLYDKKYMSEHLANQVLNFSFINNKYVLSTYLLSLLDAEKIWSDPSSMTPEELERSICPLLDGMVDVSTVIDFLESHYLVVTKDPVYAYGGVISTILKEKVKEEGLDGEAINNFMDGRINMFSQRFIADNEFIPEEYGKIYTKDMNRIKK